MRFACFISIIAISPMGAAEPDTSTPVATIRSYLAATKANDIETAKKCWTIDDENASGALDVVVGMGISSRKLVAATRDKIGADGVKALGRWDRPNCSDRAIDLTLTRIAATEVKERGEIARVTIHWESGDGEETPAFLFVKAPIILRKLGDSWKLDANVATATDKAAEMFGPNKIWPIWRDEMAAMDELTGLLDQGTIEGVAAFEKALKSKVAALKAKYEK